MKFPVFLIMLLSLSLGFAYAYSRYKTNVEYVHVKVGNFVHCEEIESLNQRKMQIECYVPATIYTPKMKADL